MFHYVTERGSKIDPPFRAKSITYRIATTARCSSWVFEGYSNQKFKGIVQAASGAFGKAATRLAAFVVKGGPYAYGSYPDIDALYR